jgi:hypothetical protein
VHRRQYYGLSLCSSYRLFRLMCKSHLTTPTHNPSILGQTRYTPLRKEHQHMSGNLNLGSPMKVVPKRHRSLVHRMLSSASLHLRVILSELIWGHSWRGTIWRCHGYCKNVPRRSRRLVSCDQNLRGVADKTGLENTGIYRLSGTTSRVQALKHALDASEPIVVRRWYGADGQMSRPLTCIRQNGAVISMSYLAH